MIERRKGVWIHHKTYLAVSNFHVAWVRRRAGAVDDAAVSDDDIESFLLP